MRIDAVEEMRYRRHATEGVGVVWPRIVEWCVRAQLPVASERLIAPPPGFTPDEPLKVGYCLCAL